MAGHAVLIDERLLRRHRRRLRGRPRARPLDRLGWLCGGLGVRPAAGYYDKVEHDRHCRDSGSHDSLQYCPPQIHRSLAGDSRAHNTRAGVPDLPDRRMSVELIGLECEPPADARGCSGDQTRE
jgi:hypothetical protein